MNDTLKIRVGTRFPGRTLLLLRPRNREPREKIKSGLSRGMVLKIVLLLFSSQVNGQVLKIVPEWKAHFKATPVIANCVFERQTPPIKDDKFLSRGETNLYQFKYQENAFLIRQIRSLNDAFSNQVPVMSVYAGYFGSNCWAIDAGETLKLFPNGKYLMRKMPENDGSLLFAAERMLFSVLFYGMNFLDPASLEWLDESKFTARSILGDEYAGEVTANSKGRPATLQWHTSKMPKTQFILEYKYDVDFDLSYFPSEIRLFMKAGGPATLGAVYKIIVLKTSTTPLEEDVFDSKRYFISSPSSPASKVFTFIDNQAYAVRNNGHLQKVLPMSMLANGSAGGANKHLKSIRILFLGFVALSVLGLYFAWKHTRTNSNKTNRKT